MLMKLWIFVLIIIKNVRTQTTRLFLSFSTNIKQNMANYRHIGLLMLAFGILLANGKTISDNAIEDISNG